MDAGEGRRKLSSTRDSRFRVFGSIIPGPTNAFWPVDPRWEPGAGSRILLTRDVGLLKRSAVTHGCFVRAVGRHLAAGAASSRSLARLLRLLGFDAACGSPLVTCPRSTSST
jgi:hypothetical protein